MQRYFIDSVLQLNEPFILSKDDNHHLINVMRGQIHDKIELVDQSETLFIAEIVQIDDRIATLNAVEIIEQQVELPVAVTIAAGLTKNDKFDWLIQKATETGMTAFIPLSLKRDVVKWDGKKSLKRLERLEKIAKEAAEQSHRLIVPEIKSLMTLKQLVQSANDYDHCIVLYEETAKQGQHQALYQLTLDLQPGDSVLAIFGSEGGLDITEIDLLTQAGFTPMSLGPRILRAETAPLYLLSALSFALEIK